MAQLAALLRTFDSTGQQASSAIDHLVGVAARQAYPQPRRSGRHCWRTDALDEDTLLEQSFAPTHHRSVITDDQRRDRSIGHAAELRNVLSKSSCLLRQDPSAVFAFLTADDLDGSSARVDHARR